MENKFEFYFDKKLVKKMLIKNALIFTSYTILSVVILLNLKSVPLTEVFISLGPVFLLYVTIRTWLQYKYNGPVIIVSPQYLIMKSMNYFLNFTDKEIKIEEIKTIGTNIKMKGNRVVSESLSFKMINEKQHTFPIDFFEISHVEIYNKIKELNPAVKLFNIGNLFLIPNL